MSYLTTLKTFAARAGVHPCRLTGMDACWERPDYEHLVKLTLKHPLPAMRAAIARRLLLDGHTGSRAWDNCFEMGDGDAVIVHLALAAADEPRLKEAIGDHYSCDSSQPNNEMRWLDFPKHFTPDGARQREFQFC